MAQDESKLAVMRVEKGEEIAGRWATPEIPEIGVYKLVAKMRMDGMFEWVHFQHRLDGTRKVLFRGEVESKEQLNGILDVANQQLKNVYGVILSAADITMATLDGRKADNKIH